jgi:hypothetical protein
VLRLHLSRVAHGFGEGVLMADTVADLAVAGATTIVSAMATDAWHAVRGGVLRLFRGHGQSRSTIEEQLDEDAELVERDEDPDAARGDLAGLWRRRLARLLAESPDAADDLSALIEQAGALLAPEQTAWVQNNIALQGGRTYGAMGGNVIHYETMPVRPEPRRAGESGA